MSIDWIPLGICLVANIDIVVVSGSRDKNEYDEIEVKVKVEPEKLAFLTRLIDTQTKLATKYFVVESGQGSLAAIVSR